MTFEKFTHVFMLRIWKERRETQNQHAPEVWRGSVEHVENNERTYFQDFTKLNDFVKDQTGALSMEKSSQGTRDDEASDDSQVDPDPKETAGRRHE